MTDADGNKLAWRYDINEKGSVTEAKAVDYLRTVVHPTMHNPRPVAEKEGDQGVIFVMGLALTLASLFLRLPWSLGQKLFFESHT